MNKKNKSEIKIKSRWFTFFSKENKNIQKIVTDTYGNKLPDNVFILRNLMSKSECNKIIHESEKYGYGETHYVKEYRGNLRLITMDETLSIVLFSRLMCFMPKTINKSWKLCGLNECFRMSKYHAGDQFMKHVDDFHKINNFKQSFFTINIYLNDNYNGGHTRFYNNNGKLVASIKAKQGDCLIFLQPLLANLQHDGEVVLDGIKYLMRSDIIYKSK